MPDEATAAGLRQHLEELGLRPTPAEIDELLPVWRERLRDWRLLEDEDLGEVQPSLTFVPPGARQ